MGVEQQLSSAVSKGGHVGGGGRSEGGRVGEGCAGGGGATAQQCCKSGWACRWGCAGRGGATAQQWWAWNNSSAVLCVR